ncbi:MAG: chemotaxis protein CheA [Planctomycetia bacterium]|nr:chemotaxis protein CheA [Planctomycetia bacterium]
MNDSPEQLTDGLMGDFLDESAELMRRLNDGLLQLDLAVKSNASPIATDQELLNDIFRAAHSLKGLSGMMGMQDINSLTHKIENVFDAVRCGRLDVSSSVVDVSFQAIDRLDAMIELLKGSGGDEVECREVFDRIEQVLQSKTVELPATGTKTDAQLTPVAGSSQIFKSEDPLGDLQDDPDVPAKYLGIFIDEADLTLDTISDVLLQEPDATGVESLLVCCHRIKGSAASIGLRRVARLAHFMEDQLQDLRRRDASPSNELIDALLVSVDSIRGYINHLRSGSPTADGLGEACRKMSALAISIDAESPSPSTADRLNVGESIRRRLQSAAAHLPRNSSGYVGSVHFEPGLALVELKARVLLEKLHRVGDVFFCSPAEDEFDTVADFTDLVFGIATASGLERLDADMRISGVTNVELTPLASNVVTDTGLKHPVATTETTQQAFAIKASIDEVADAIAEDIPAASSPTAVVATDSKTKPTETLRVDIERLDQLMSLAGQLVITKARFSQIGLKLKRIFSDKSASASLAEAVKQVDRLVNEVDDCRGERSAKLDSLAIGAKQIREDLGVVQRDMGRVAEVRSLLTDLAEAVHQLDRVSDGIQKSVMDTRMVPIGPLFSRFKRVVRDLSRAGEKDIQLEIRGEHTELDKRMIDELGDPLIHLIRNSADHGIESPEARVAAGKPRQGAISLNAFHRGNRIIIKVSDDGRGLDAGRIRAKAVAKGWMNEAEAEKLSDAQVYQLIWRPGFSTAERVTEVSGRGMGMDIVWSKIEQLSGSVELSSEPGHGTTFEIKLPLTMAILPSLLMVIDRDVFAVPVESVIEIVRIASADLTTVYGSPMARVRGRVISLVRLNDLFGECVPQIEANRESSNVTIVICGSEGRELGIIVDDLLGEQDVVIKSLTENFQNVNGIAGASILGDGRVSLILDVAALLEMACGSSHESLPLPPTSTISTVTPAVAS